MTIEFKVMSRNGDDRFTYDSANVQSVGEAMTKFQELVGGPSKMFAYTAGANAEIVKEFDPEKHAALIFSPQLQGG